MDINYILRRKKKMKVFISWSGKESQQVAEILKTWIPCIIQSIEPYFSSSDIDKGARWSTDIAKELQDASFGILCVTKENISSQWLNFEAGALSKSIDQSKVCPFLVDLKPSEIKDSPILQFQMTSATQEDVLKLFNSLNSNLGESRLTESVLNSAFEMFWPKIDEALKSITLTSENPDKPQVELQSNQLDEILELLRYQHKLLNNPMELLPPDYLMDIVRKNEKLMRRKNYPRSYSSEMMEYASNLHQILSRWMDEYDISDNTMRSISERTSTIHKATELSERLLMLIKRSEYDERF